MKLSSNSLLMSGFSGMKPTETMKSAIDSAANGMNFIPSPGLKASRFSSMEKKRVPSLYCSYSSVGMPARLAMIASDFSGFFSMNSRTSHQVFTIFCTSSGRSLIRSPLTVSRSGMAPGYSLELAITCAPSRCMAVPV